MCVRFSQHSRCQAYLNDPSMLEGRKLISHLTLKNISKQLSARNGFGLVGRQLLAFNLELFVFFFNQWSIEEFFFGGGIAAFLKVVCP